MPIFFKRKTNLSIILSAKKVAVLSALSVFSVHAEAYCFEEAAAAYEIHPSVLQAIAKHESGNRPALVLKNSNGTFDIGLMGINTVNLAPYGSLAMLKPEQLLDPCTNVMAGTFLLQRKVAKYGMTWAAIGAYHSETPVHSSRYQWLIYGVMNKNKPK